MVKHRLVILYGVGGLSDVGRHAVQAALERPDDVESITVLTQFPEALQEANWKCGCEKPHAFTDGEKARMKVVTVKSWKDQHDELKVHFENATAVISCLGNRQPFVGHCDAAEGNVAVIDCVKQTPELNRVVVCTSVGIEEDWPAVEFFKFGQYIMSAMFMTISKASFRDLTAMERAYRATAKNEVDFLLVRPVGIGEDVKPVNSWVLQTKKYGKDVELGINMAKLDVARYMVEEAIHPTRHRDAVVIGASS